jgi:hypothetical protein
MVFDLNDREYSLGGAYRKILHLPSAVTHKLIPYSDPNIDLAQSDEDILLRKKLPNPIVPGEPLNLALQIELTLGSSTCSFLPFRRLIRSIDDFLHCAYRCHHGAARVAQVKNVLNRSTRSDGSDGHSTYGRGNDIDGR